MDIENARLQLKSKSIYDYKMRVTFYARVSSEKDEQLNSLDNQIDYYKDMIEKNNNWEYVNGYIDEGISGISTIKRESFNNMINDASLNKFDLIITKEISRFARNTLDSIKYTRQLLQTGVGVFFQNDNINTLDEDSELRLTIMSSIAQDELRKLSSRIKFGHHQSIKNGVVFGNSRIFGYDKDNKKLIINEKEAEMIKKIYELYATNEYSLKQIEKILYEKGYKNRNGNKIAHSTLSAIISNPKYKGYYCGNKVRITDLFTKKQKFLPEEDWIMYKDEDKVPSIVSEELWAKANIILKKRSDDVKNRQGKCNHPNLLTGKLFCSHCGTPFYRRESKDKNGNINSIWICSGKLSNGAKTCPTFSIYESEIKQILSTIFDNENLNIEEVINNYIKVYKDINTDKNVEKEMEQLNKSVDMITRKKSKLLEYNIGGKISDSDFLNMNKQCEDELNNAYENMSELQKQIDEKNNIESNIKIIKKNLMNAKGNAKNKIIDKDFVEKYIQRIDVESENEKMVLKIKLITDNIIVKDYVRTGSTIKKMIQQYENGMK